ncbi:MAG: cupin domain-containing protein, partial [Chloroflexales bacterium]
ARALPARYRSSRAASTAIYFLLEGRQISALHRMVSDEIWFFHAGSTLRLDLIGPAGEARVMRLGLRPGCDNCLPQALIPKDWWFGARIESGRGFALVSCTVAPGFDFADFELGQRAALLASHPAHASVIRALTSP